jgi:hypothetical protein
MGIFADLSFTSKLVLMNPSESDIIALPIELYPYRDQLRVVGYDLVRYTVGHAQREARKYRHPAEDYEYAIHKIEFIEANDGQIFINRNPFYTSATRVPDWTNYHVKKEKPQGFGILKSWFTEPAHTLLTVIVPPFGLTLLGLAVVGDRVEAKQQRERHQLLACLLERPKFVLPFSRK